MSDYGSYEIIDGRPRLRFERRLAHPVDKVWAAVTDPAQLRHWFPAELMIEPRAGGRVTFTFPDEYAPPSQGEVRELDPPRRFAFTWDQDVLEFELEPAGEDACILRFSHLLTETDRGAMVAAGWHVCLGELEKLLAGEPAHAPTSEPTDQWRALYEVYAQQGFPTGAALPS